MEQAAVSIGARPVLAAITCTFEPASVTALLGQNGAGKSTLLKAVAGLLALTDGRITLGAVDIAGLNRSALARSIAYLPQDRTVSWPLSARDVVALGRLPHGAQLAALSAADTAHVDDALAKLDLAPIADRPVTQLSGGERARVLVARALAQDAAVLVADEPLAGLDPAAQLVLAGLLTDLARAGRTVIVAIHDLSMARRMADRVVMLADGGVTATGDAKVCLQPGPIQRCFGLKVELATVAGIPLVVPVAPAKDTGKS